MLRTPLFPDAYADGAVANVQAKEGKVGTSIRDELMNRLTTPIATSILVTSIFCQFSSAEDRPPAQTGADVTEESEEQHAREKVPQLLKEIELLKAQVAQLQAKIARQESGTPKTEPAKRGEEDASNVKAVERASDAATKDVAKPSDAGHGYSYTQILLKPLSDDLQYHTYTADIINGTGHDVAYAYFTIIAFDRSGSVVATENTQAVNITAGETRTINDIITSNGVPVDHCQLRFSSDVAK